LQLSDSTTHHLSKHRIFFLPRHLQDAESLYASFITPPFPPTSHIPTKEHIIMRSRDVRFLRNHLPERALNLTNLLISGT
jgi:hypothetical protein